MSNALIFVSCGQYTEPEKRLGKAIVQIAESVTGQKAFFAEQVQDLNGLDANILNALRDCAAFITVMHPRGAITRPDGSTHTRASVWIEQEIAIATYIKRVEKRTLPVIAFVHKSIGREGIRDLLHLNPILFTQETEVLVALPELLKKWGSLSPTGIQVQLQSGSRVYRDGHWIRQLSVNLANDSNQRISDLSFTLRMPTGVLSHWTHQYLSETKSGNPNYRSFRYDNVPLIGPHETRQLITFDYCTACGAEYTGEPMAFAGAIVAESVVEAKVWFDGREYSAKKTIKELSDEAEAREHQG